MQKIHGMRRDRNGKTTRIYKAWVGMLQRCNNPKGPDYANYGGRGIKVCERWHTFANFYADMGDDNGLTLDRIKNDANYCKENCRWATRREQANNYSWNMRLTIDGREMSLSDAIRYVDSPLEYETVRRRIGKYKWDYMDALLMPVKTVRKPRREPVAGCDRLR